MAAAMARFTLASDLPSLFEDPGSHEGAPGPLGSCRTPGLGEGALRVGGGKEGGGPSGEGGGASIRIPHSCKINKQFDNG